MNTYALEANFDGLVGPTHNYAGLSYGNIASEANASTIANPKAAAKQGLVKMKALADMGFAQGLLPPQERPSVSTLRALGFAGSDAEVIRQAAQRAPELLAAASSASSMWTANAATVSPSADTADAHVHFTPANLCSKLHRAIEHETTSRILEATFADERHFAHHAALPGVPALGDEGAANHTRFCASYGAAGVEFFVFGRSEFDRSRPIPRRYPARQTLEASQAIARRHGLEEGGVVFAEQTPEAIDAGVFHNDVIAVGNRNVLFCHERAFVNQPRVYEELCMKLAARGGELNVIEVPQAVLPIEDVVQTYLFNSQLLSREDGSMLIVVPQECCENPRVWRYLEELTTSGGPIREARIFNLRESMKNGGGPACLRLRVALTEAERSAVNPAVWVNDSLFGRLNTWVDKHYRDRLADADLADPALLDEGRAALDELTRILQLGSIYLFQRA